MGEATMPLVLRNGKPIDEEEFENADRLRAEAMRQWHANHTPVERDPGHSGQNIRWTPPRKGKYNRTFRV